MAKFTLRVPTAQYAYIESEFEGTAEDAVERYEALTRLVQGGEGLPAKEWNALLDTYMSTGAVENGAEVWETLTKQQQWLFQELKKSKARLETK